MIRRSRRAPRARFVAGGRPISDRTLLWAFVLAAVVTVAAITLLSRHAAGESLRRVIVVTCSDREDWVRTLANGWHERPLLEGVTRLGDRAELFVARGSLSWTFVVTTPAGHTCVLAEGGAIGPAINILPEEMNP